jgi:hypothetical protein
MMMIEVYRVQALTWAATADFAAPLRRSSSAVRSGSASYADLLDLARGPVS